MNGIAAIIGLVQVASLLLLGLNILLYRRHVQRYRMLLSGFKAQRPLGKTGHVLIPLYVLLTTGICVVTLYLQLWKPHLL